MAERLPERLSVRGFATVGVVNSSSDQAEFVRDLSQPRGARGGGWTAKVDSLAGLQANWQVDEQWELVGQAVSRYRADASYRPELVWAFARWDANPNLSLRAGRLGTEFFMQADSRLVGYSYLPVRPAPDYFGILPFTYIDGADAAATLPLAGGLARGKVFAGRLRETAPLADRLWNLSGSLMRGGHAEFQAGPWMFRLGHARLRFRHDLPIGDLTALLRAVPLPGGAATADALAVAGRESDFNSAGVVYDSGPLQLQFMLNRARHESTVFQDSRAGYLLAGYRLGAFTPFAGYSWTRSTPKTLDTGLPNLGPLTALNAAVATVLADSHAHQHTWTAGLRWDVRSNMDLKLQFDSIRGAPQSIFPYRGELPGWSGRTRVLSLAMDMVF